MRVHRVTCWKLLRHQFSGCACPTFPLCSQLYRGTTSRYTLRNHPLSCAGIDYRVLTPLLAPLSPHVEHARLSVHLAQSSVGYWCDTHHRCPFLIYCSLLSCPAQASARDASNYCYELYPFSLSFIFLWEPFVTFPP